MLQITEYNASLNLGLQKDHWRLITTEKGLAGVITTKVCRSLLYAILLNRASAS